MPVTHGRLFSQAAPKLTDTELLDTPVRDIMTPGIVSIVEDASLARVHHAMVAHDVHAILVVGRKDGRPLGWVTARGLLGWAEADHDLSYVRDAITESPATVPPTATAREAISALCRPGVSHLLVAHTDDSLPEGVLSDLDLVALTGGAAWSGG